MARKDLSRTVIEGGRRYSNCYFRRQSHGTARARTREWLDHVRFEAEAADETSPRAAPRVHKRFHDKLAPAKRWLGAQVGRPWVNVYADLCAAFDTRTIAGRHVVHDHMLAWVWRGDVSSHRRWDSFFVDVHGILRHNPHHGRAWQRARDQLVQWAGDRVAANTFWGWWWFRREPAGAPCDAYPCREHDHIVLRGKRYHGIRYQADARVTAGELRRLERLQADLRDVVVRDLAALQRESAKR